MSNKPSFFKEWTKQKQKPQWKLIKWFCFLKNKPKLNKSLSPRHLLLQIPNFASRSLTSVASKRQSSSILAKSELKLVSVNSFTVMIPMDNYCVPSTSTTGLVFPANSSMTSSSGFHFTVNSPASVTGLKHEASLAVDWSVEEQYILEKGLSKFKDEPQVTKYVKIAATLPDKSVRDVAMRCKWMTQKRRKGEEHSAGTKASYRKVVDLPPKLNMFSTMPQQNATYVMNHMSQNARMPFEGLSDVVMERLRQNAQAFGQISSNLSVSKV